MIGTWTYASNNFDFIQILRFSSYSFSGPNQYLLEFNDEFNHWNESLKWIQIRTHWSEFKYDLLDVFNNIITSMMYLIISSTINSIMNLMMNSMNSWVDEYKTEISSHTWYLRTTWYIGTCFCKIRIRDPFLLQFYTNLLFKYQLFEFNDRVNRSLVKGDLVRSNLSMIFFYEK